MSAKLKLVIMVLISTCLVTANAEERVSQSDAEKAARLEQKIRGARAEKELQREYRGKQLKSEKPAQGYKLPSTNRYSPAASSSYSSQYSSQIQGYGNEDDDVQQISTIPKTKKHLLQRDFNRSTDVRGNRKLHNNRIDREKYQPTTSTLREYSVGGVR